MTRTSFLIALPPIASLTSYTSNETRLRSLAAAGRRPYSSFSNFASSSGARTFCQSPSVLTSAPPNVLISSGTPFGATTGTKAKPSATT